MAVTDLFAGEIATELVKQLVKQLVAIARKSSSCKSSAEQLVTYIEAFMPIIREIKYSGVELPETRQFQLDRFSEVLSSGLELCRKVRSSGRWNVYRNLQFARKMEKLEQSVSRFVQGPMQAHLMADLHILRFGTTERFDQVEGSLRRLERRLGTMKIGGGGQLEEAVKRTEEEQRWEGSSVNLSEGLDLRKRKVKEMVLGNEELTIFEICGIAGSGKTTLAKEFLRDDQVLSYFSNRILFLTVSQSPDVEELRARIWGFISGNNSFSSNDVIPQWNPQFDWRVEKRALVVLDDVWSSSVLEKLILRMPGCKTLVVSRFKFSVSDLIYDVELMNGDESLSLFCHYAFGMNFIPRGADENLVRQIVNECKGLPLALKVIGASLRDQSELYWVSAKTRLSRGESICDSHENQLLEPMAISVGYLPKKVQECFLDLGSFLEDKKIPLDVLINMWVEIHGIEEEEAFAILVELSNKNLLTLVKDSRAGDMYSSYYEISVTQHDVIRDIALHLSNCGNINERKRLLMPRRESEVPREWERNADQPFNARIVAVHTGEMREMDWCSMEFPKAEVLILNFSSREFFLPPFINSMPKLRALIVINYSTSNAILHNFSVVSNLANLRSLWLEKVCLPQLSISTIPMKKLKKVSLVLCKISNSIDESLANLPEIFPCLSELTIDHSDDLTELPSSICKMDYLKILSVTNCHNLHELPADIGKVKCLNILRLYACPSLKSLPPSMCELHDLKYLDISQCVNLKHLPEDFGKLSRLEKIDMRECLLIMNLPESVAFLQSLRCVICDEEVSWEWKDIEEMMSNLHIQVAEKCFNLDWLDE